MKRIDFMLWLSVAAMLGSLCLMPGGCDQSEEQAYQNAVNLAAQSKAVYDAVADPVAQRLGALAGEFRKHGTLSEPDQQVYRALRAFQPAVEGYAQVHQAYLASLKAWQVARDAGRGDQPPDLNQLYGALQKFIAEGTDVLRLLKE